MTTEISGRIGRGGPIIDVQFGTSHLQGERLLKRGMTIPEPVTVAAMIDTGAQASSLDLRVIDRLGLAFVRQVLLVTNTTDLAGQPRDQYSALATIGVGQDEPLAKTVLVIKADFAARGFLALIGRDLLQYCVFTYHGPGERFTLAF